MLRKHTLYIAEDGHEPKKAYSPRINQSNRYRDRCPSLEENGIQSYFGVELCRTTSKTRLTFHRKQVPSFVANLSLICAFGSIPTRASNSSSSSFRLFDLFIPSN